MTTSLQPAFLALADRIAQSYGTHAHPQAILLTGSVADGTCDSFSDIDMSMYYDVLPTTEQLQQARDALGAQEFFFLAPPTDDACVEDFRLERVECQIAHATIAEWERTLDQVLVQYDLSPLQKAVSGLLRGHALAGNDLIQQWQSRAKDYPPALGRAMVEQYLKIFPLWYRRDFMQQRDAVLWMRELLVETGYFVLGILAGLNQRYYTPFQLKQMHHFVATLTLAPQDLSSRLERLATNDIATAIDEAEQLVRECVDLVHQHMPEVDTSAMQRRLGQQQAPWSP